MLEGKGSLTVYKYYWLGAFVHAVVTDPLPILIENLLASIVIIQSLPNKGVKRCFIVIAVLLPKLVAVAIAKLYRELVITV